MSKLTETLQNQVSGNLKGISITFDSNLLEQELIDKLGNYLSTKSVDKLIELAFAITSTKKLNIQQSIIDQIQYKSAKKLIEVISQKSTTNMEKLQQVTIPRWMVLILGSEIQFLNGKYPLTTEDVINLVLRLCLDLLAHSIGNNGQSTKKVS
ncbi:hypothetical protein [Sphaerospermopsis torques-reginae]|uniref:Tetracyclin repressor-like C-terminal domain-containing protein n=1 Tax=Sphaerospermopsis torques-reginae ITEP-024 TaxID=984208 RepID=A0ABX8WW05_9CYAN|nr:hypothetical protein [Sphaerospermopsis torques-reginae]QYX30613.1 hypothetical protein K2F26_17210 [Sphaerospermopsis torques-reginae ITEP-024]